MRVMEVIIVIVVWEERSKADENFMRIYSENFYGLQNKLQELACISEC
jgi:hypothetical protein